MKQDLLSPFLRDGSVEAPFDELVLGTVEWIHSYISADACDIINFAYAPFFIKPLIA